MRLSPDGRRVAVELADRAHIGTRDLWMLDTATQALSRLTTNPATDWRAVFSPDGSTLAFAIRSRRRVDGLAQLDERHPAETSSCFRDGRLAASFRLTGRATASSLMVSREDLPGGARQDVADDPGTVAGLRRWWSTASRCCSIAARVAQRDRVAFTSLANAATVEVYVVSVDGRRRVACRAEGGSNPRGGPTVTELFFLNPRGELMRATLEADHGAGRPARRRVSTVRRRSTARIPRTVEPNCLRPQCRRHALSGDLRSSRHRAVRDQRHRQLAEQAPLSQRLNNPTSVPRARIFPTIAASTAARVSGGDCPTAGTSIAASSA